VTESILEQALETAYQYLARIPRSCSEVENQLRRKGYPPSIIRRVIRQLLEFRYLNDEAFARQWARERVVRRHWGPLRIRSELVRKGIGKSQVDEVLQELLAEQDEVGRAAELLEGWLRGRPVSNPREYRRSYGYLFRRGYSTDVIETVLRRFEDKLGIP